VKTILLAEDDAQDVFFMRCAAQDVGIHDALRVVQDGQEAVDYLEGCGEYADRQRFPRPCLVLLDLKLPRVTGFEVLKWIRQQPALKTLIVIVLSSSGLEKDVDLAYRLGTNSYLVKPLTPHQLREMLKRLKQYWLDLNRHAPECVELAAEDKEGRPKAADLSGRAASL
jgi:CheY-like chemotaxis protein